MGLLDRLLHPDYDPEKHAPRDLEGKEYIPPEPDPITEVKLLWQEFHCKCGRKYSSPQFHPEPMQIKRQGKKGATLETVCTSHAIPRGVPVRTETTTYRISTCPECVENPTGGGEQIPLMLDGEEQLPRFSASSVRRRE